MSIKNRNQGAICAVNNHFVGQHKQTVQTNGHSEINDASVSAPVILYRKENQKKRKKAYRLNHLMITLFN